MIFSARPLPITRDEPLTIISSGPLKGAAFFFLIFTPGTIPRSARRFLALKPAFTFTTSTTSPLLHSVKHLRSEEDDKFLAVSFLEKFLITFTHLENGFLRDKSSI
jgi:hypothetical protein